MKLIKDYFSFTKSEVRGLLLVFIIILTLIIIRICIRTEYDGFILSFHSVKDSTLEMHAKLSEEQSPLHYAQFEPAEKNKNSYSETFDPNTALYDDLLERGFSVYVARRIIKYRLNGGRFNNANDLLKIYGIDSGLVYELSEEIHIDTQVVYSKNKYRNSSGMKAIDLNQADSVSLEQVPGIGGVLSARIVKYRELLGGYYSSLQLSEVYGINDSLALRMSSFFQVDSSYIHKINLNEASAGEIGRHPYLSSNQAKAIVSFRKLIGPFKTKNQLLEYYILSESDLMKLAPYLTLN